MEWHHLDSTAYTYVERMIIFHYLEKYLPPNGIILDAGGGTGTYSIELAKRGYQVVLMDMSEDQLGVARQLVAEQPLEVRDRIFDFVLGSIDDLTVFPDGHFDAVISLGGTLSHLLSCQAREKAASEVARVSRDKAPVFVSVLSFYGAMRKILSEYPEDMLQLPDFLEARLAKGGTQFHDCFFFTPEEMVDLLARKGIEVVEYVGVQGLSAHLEAVTQDCFNHPERWKVWEEVLLRTCNHPSVVGVSDHILAVGFA
jgi:ubiquinone/menaquinone biosynthesis C-methylase UbiE